MRNIVANMLSKNAHITLLHTELTKMKTNPRDPRRPSARGGINSENETRVLRRAQTSQTRSGLAGVGSVSIREDVVVMAKVCQYFPSE